MNPETPNERDSWPSPPAHAPLPEKWLEPQPPEPPAPPDPDQPSTASGCLKVAGYIVVAFLVMGGLLFGTCLLLI